jgi:hypothetical protein
VAEERERAPLALVRPLASEEPAAETGVPGGSEEEEPFPEAVAPFGSPPTDVRAAEVESLKTRLEIAERRLDETGDALADDVAALARRTEERFAALEQRLEAESSTASDAREKIAGEVDRLREHAERLEQRTSELARDLEEIERRLLEKADRLPREPEELKLQLAPILEEQVRRETDENWTAEIERLRQALAESLDDLSERVRKAVRG